jgi:hypothetical protein
VFGIAINQLLFLKGLDLTVPINAAVIMVSTPIMVLIVAAVLIRERITAAQGFGNCPWIGGRTAHSACRKRGELQFRHLCWRPAHPHQCHVLWRLSRHRETALSALSSHYGDEMGVPVRAFHGHSLWQGELRQVIGPPCRLAS